MLHIHPFNTFNIRLMCILSCAQVWKNGAKFILKFKDFFFFSPTVRHLFISTLLFDLSAQHPASAMGRHLSSETRVVVAVPTPAHVLGHTRASLHTRLVQGNKQPDCFGWKAAETPMLRGGRHARQGLRIPGGQLRESCFQPSLTHICLSRG